MTPMTPMTEGFLLGAISTASFAAGMFFLKFWRRTRDLLFLAFGVAFIVEGFDRISPLFLPHPNNVGVWYYVVRILAYLLILAAILKKNYGQP